MQDVMGQFISAGLIVDAFLVGSFERCPVEGDKGRKESGWYVLHEITLDSGNRVLVGRFGNWKRYGDTALKVEFDTKALSAADQQRLREKSEEIKKIQQADRDALAAEAAVRADKIWNGLQRFDSGKSEYLSRKKVGAYGVRFSRGSIVVPVRNSSGKLVGLQFIDGEGNKKFLTGTPKRGCYHAIGSIRDDLPLIIAEGYATGASLHKATGFPVAIAFDAGNLKPVAIALREKFPNVRFVIAADNDVATEGNPGVTKANEAAAAVQAVVAVPNFERVAA